MADEKKLEVLEEKDGFRRVAFDGGSVWINVDGYTVSGPPSDVPAPVAVVAQPQADEIKEAPVGRTAKAIARDKKAREAAKAATAPTKPAPKAPDKPAKDETPEQEN